MGLKRVLIRAKHAERLDEENQQGMVDGIAQQLHDARMCGEFVISNRWSLYDLEAEQDTLKHHIRKIMSDDRILSHEMLDEWYPSEWTSDALRGHCSTSSRYEKVRAKIRS